LTAHLLLDGPTTIRVESGRGWPHLVRLGGLAQPTSAVRLRLGETLEPVVGDGLPGRGVGHERAPARSHAGVAIEGSHAHTHLRVVIGVAAEEMCSASSAEQLLEAAFRMAPSLYEILALQETQSATIDSRLHRGCGPGSALAAGAVAVARAGRTLGQLEANRTTQASTAHRGIAHGR
jgi:hypothetical protein